MDSATSRSITLDKFGCNIADNMRSRSFGESIAGCGNTSWKMGSFGTFDLLARRHCEQIYKHVCEQGTKLELAINAPLCTKYNRNHNRNIPVN